LKRENNFGLQIKEGLYPRVELLIRNLQPVLVQIMFGHQVLRTIVAVLPFASYVCVEQRICEFLGVFHPCAQYQLINQSIIQSSRARNKQIIYQQNEKKRKKA
jgi:hypothetical protein